MGGAPACAKIRPFLLNIGGTDDLANWIRQEMPLLARQRAEQSEQAQEFKDGRKQQV